MKRRTLVLLMVLGLLIAAVPAASAHGGSDKATLTWFVGAPALGLAEEADVGSPAGNGAHTRLTRGDDTVWAQVHSRNLSPGHAYTVWAIVWNDPGNCGDPIPGTGSLCGEGDLGNVAAGSGAFWSGMSGVANAAGNLNLRGHIHEDVAPGEVLFGELLTDAENAEIHFIVRDHGPASDDPATLEAQLTTVGGGCGDFDCDDPQASIHVGNA